MGRSTSTDLTPAQQFLFLRRNPVCAGTGVLNAKGLSWDYRVRPTTLSREYVIRITLQKGGPPKAFVIEPDIQILAGERQIPHVYRNPLRLCLYLPGSNEWLGSMRIDKNFVPWVATWLFYFEEWLASDEWKGGGEHPDPEAEELGSRAIRQLAARGSDMSSR